MKLEAEDFLINNCDSIFSSIIRPGLVYHDKERPWSLPLGLLSNLGHTVTNGQGPPGTSLRVLADITVREALKDRSDDESSGHQIISAVEMKTPFPL